MISQPFDQAYRKSVEVDEWNSMELQDKYFHFIKH